MADGLDSGKSIRILNIMDDYNREVLAVEIDHSLPSKRVVRVLEQLIADRGAPKQIRVDNGPEFTACALEVWCKENAIHLEYIKPGKPTQNAYIERLNRTYREDVLDVYLFRSLDDAREQSFNWMMDYNYERPHKALGGPPPRAFIHRIHDKDPLVLTGT